MTDNKNTPSKIWFRSLNRYELTKVCMKYKVKEGQPLTDDQIDQIYLSEHPQPEEQVKEVDILKEDYNILNYKYAECIKVNTGLKEVNKILVDALLKIDAIAYRFYGWKVADDLAEIAKTSLKEANLIK